jgi:uncharacterized protein
MKTLALTQTKTRQWLTQLDQTWLAIAAIAASIAFLDYAQLGASLAFVFASVKNTFGFLLLSVLLTAYAKASGVDNLIARAFTGPPAFTIITAALMGALSPFCSCGVIPIIVALLATGVPLAPVMAFWLASPLMDPSMFVMTSATLGAEFAIAKTIAAVGVGLLGGFGALALTRLGVIGNVLKAGVGNGGCAGATIRQPKAIVWKFWTETARISVAAASFKSNVLFLVKWLVLAFLLESLMVAYLPHDLVARVAGGSGVMPIVLATLIGVPSYLNGYAALPLVNGLLTQGLSPGAGMAFLIGGGVTSLPAAIAVWAVTSRRVFVAYLGFALVGALLSGLAFGAWRG